MPRNMPVRIRGLESELPSLDTSIDQIGQVLQPIGSAVEFAEMGEACHRRRIDLAILQLCLPDSTRARAARAIPAASAGPEVWFNLISPT